MELIDQLGLLKNVVDKHTIHIEKLAINVISGKQESNNIRADLKRIRKHLHNLNNAVMALQSPAFTEVIKPKKKVPRWEVVSYFMLGVSLTLAFYDERQKILEMIFKWVF